MSYSCSDFTDEIMQWLATHVELGPIEDDDPQQQSVEALNALRELLERGSALATIIEGILHDKRLTKTEMVIALSEWLALVKTR